MQPSMILDRRTGAPLYVSTVSGWAQAPDMTVGWAEGDVPVSGVAGVDWPDVYAGLADLPPSSVLAAYDRQYHYDRASGELVSAANCASWTPDIIDGAHWLVPYDMRDAVAIAGLFDDIGKAFKSVGDSIGQAATSVVHTVGKLAQDAGKLAQQFIRDPLGVAKDAFKIITNNPLWDMAKSAASFIPGVGTAVSAGMAAAAAVGRGASMKDIALEAVRGAIPGGPVVQAAFDIGSGVLLKGQSLDSAALAFVRNQVPGGDAGKQAFDTATAVILGKHAGGGDMVIQAAKGALPNVPILRGAFEAAAGLARAKFASPPIVKAVAKTLPKIAGPAFKAGLVAAKVKQITPKTVAIVRQQIPPGPARKAVEKSIVTAIQAKKVVLAKKDAKSVVLHALTVARRLAVNDPFSRGKLLGMQIKAKKGDRASVTALAIMDLASKTLKATGQVPKPLAKPAPKPIPKPAARTAGEVMPMPLMLTAEDAAIMGGIVGDLVRQGYQLWISPRPRPTHRKFGLAW